MQSSIDSLLSQLVSLLGPLSPFTKAVVPAAGALLVAVVNSLFAGSIDTASVSIAASGLVLAVVVFLLPNKPKPVVPPRPGK